VKIVKVRRVGNSNVVSLPRALEGLGYTAGTQLAVQELPNGELRLVRTAELERRLGKIAHELVDEDHEALEGLAAYDSRGISSAAMTPR